MSVQMVLELQQKEGAQTIWAALDAYRSRLQASIVRTQRRLAQFEQKYGVNTAVFLAEMSAEELEGGDMEYVAWAGEAHLLTGLQQELGELEYVHRQF
jgi:hypothetical protein